MIVPEGKSDRNFTWPYLLQLPVILKEQVKAEGEEPLVDHIWKHSNVWYEGNKWTSSWSNQKQDKQQMSDFEHQYVLFV